MATIYAKNLSCSYIRTDPMAEKYFVKWKRDIFAGALKDR